jgi:TonB family protein
MEEQNPMFDKMIVSDANAVESRGRSRYFIVSSLIVGALFVSAVVVSIYAVDIDLGTEEFELSMMLAPVDNMEPEPPKVEQPRNQAASTPSQPTIRNADIPHIEDTPTTIPDNVSAEKPTSLTRPKYGDYKIDPNAIETVGRAGVPNGSPFGRGDGRPPGSSSADSGEPENIVAKIPDPPPAINPKPLAPKSLGVVNGRASSLPKPPYPVAAMAVNAQGEVSVQVTIDETGKVVSARAVSGHPLLRRESERAAMNARFSPTTLSKVPVKVTGVIVYNFKR